MVDGHSIDNTALEVQALKFAYDQSFMDCMYQFHFQFSLLYYIMLLVYIISSFY